jgi:hypothetical protein
MEKGQLARPGIAPLPLIVIATVDPLRWPVPVPVTVVVPRHRAVNDPETSVEVSFVIVHVKFAQVGVPAATGDVTDVVDVHVPSSDDVDTDAGGAVGSDGAVTLFFWKSQAATVTAAASSTAEYKFVRLIELRAF